MADPHGPTAQQALSAARCHAEGFRPARGDSARLAVVACMDRRLDPMSLLGLQPGDAYVIRNAGGLLTEDVRRSLAIAQHLLGVEEILVVRHTDCGMTGLVDEELLEALTEATGRRPQWSPGGFTDVGQALSQDLADLAADPHVPGGATARGIIYDVTTGAITEVRRAGA
ncbi:beta-class carbonic anhydrase [Actinomyces capricornis]|uniref:carbonic anhydrase n=1 Tax=Actinomyces capricornis TaxID=2755559 RepID=A0ABN6K5X4_9ACTO|nr:carbonic anhydrase [Actinomyces capricornis]BDA64958.1 carbonic anhydrase [Actinomyces capricornis]